MAIRDSDYIFSECSAKAISELYPVLPGNKQSPALKSIDSFMRAQRALQKALIRCHMPHMDSETVARAARTLDWLDRQDAEPVALA